MMTIIPHLNKHPPSHHEHAEVRQVSSHPEHGGLEVFLVASQVYESDDLGGLLTDFGPVQASSVTVRLIHHLNNTEKWARLNPQDSHCC